MKLELISGPRLSFALCAALALAGAAHAQGPRAEKLSEYVNQFYSCDAGAHLDNLVIHIQNNPTTTGYLRIYGPGGPDNGYGERAVRATRNYLVDTRGLEGSRVRVVSGGRSASLWDGPEEGEGFADVLKADTQLTGCLVVRLAPAEPKDVNPEYAVDPDETPDVDVLQLAERWKAELKKNGVGEHRLIVMVVPTRETQSGGEIETWVVPPGAPLPDPSAEDEVSAAEAEAENPKEF